MNALTAAELLSVWEWGLERGPLERGLVLLVAACPRDDLADLLSLSIGRRDARLLALRELTFGPQLDTQVTCPACQERLELGFRTTDLRALAPPAGSVDDATHHIEHAGWHVHFRLLNSQDLFDAIAESADPAGARQALLRRCVLEVTLQGEAGLDPPVRALPAEVEVALLAHIQRYDPASNIAFALTCPACGHEWTTTFDIISFFWTEIDAWAYRTMREVHLLASAYAWSETDILALSPHRRQAYLQMIGHA